MFPFYQCLLKVQNLEKEKKKKKDARVLIKKGKKEHCYYFSKVIKQAQILNEILTLKK